MSRPPRASALAPAMRADLTLTPEEADLSAAAVDAFTVALGGRQALLDTLAVADGTPEVHTIVNLLLDPRYSTWSLRRICHLAGLTVADLFVAYRKALLVKAHLQAGQLVAQHLTAVVDDVMKRAQPYEVTCETCAGLTMITPEPTKAQPNPVPGTCPTCRGAGRLICHPDLDRQKVALELGQLLQTRAGISIQQNSVQLPAGGIGPAGQVTPGALEQLQQAVHEVLYPRAQVTEAPAVETPAVPIDGEVVGGECARE